jgi:hypothetical protein
MEESALTCRTHAKITACGCRFRKRVCGCNKADCATCAGKVGRERGERIYRKMLATAQAVAARFPHVQDPRMFSVRSWVFTVPPEARHLCLTAAGVRKLRKALAAVMVEQLGAAAVCIIPHPVGDRDKDCRTFHPHFNVLWVADGPARMVPATEDARKALRELARGSWDAVLGLDGLELRSVVYMHAAPLNEEGRIRFFADYNARVFAGWRRWSPKWVQWFGKPTKAPPRPCSEGCEHCHEQERTLAEGEDAVREQLAFLETVREGGPPQTLHELAEGYRDEEGKWVQPVAVLPGDVGEFPFEWFHEGYIATTHQLARPPASTAEPPTPRADTPRASHPPPEQRSLALLTLVPGGAA